MKIRKLAIYATTLLLAANKANVSALTSAKGMGLQEAISTGNYDIDRLIIKSEDLEKLKDIDLDDFSNLSSIELDGVYINDGKIMNLDKKVDVLEINNSVVNISSFDSNDFDDIRVMNSYNIGKKVKNRNVSYNDFLNEEYKLYKKYDKKLSKIAKKIKKSSDGTKKDLIRKATLYVVNNLSYDDDTKYMSLPMMKSILDKKKGVCAHYAALESQLLNRLGIFSIDVSGYVSQLDRENTTHAWVITYVNNKWYSIDPTWMDTEESISDLNNNRQNVNYMAPIDDTSFNSSHNLYFTEFDKIPKKYRKARY